MPRVLNKYKDDLSGAIYAGRGSPYGNRFVIGPDGDRPTVIRKFVCEQLPHMNVEPLRGEDVWCFCHPQPCHVHWIFRKLYGPYAELMINV